MLILRFFKMLALTMWTGSIFFFAAVVAPTAFSVLPSHNLAGMVVSRSLLSLHWIGMVCGLVFLLCSVLLAAIEGGPTPFHSRDLLILAMLVVTFAAHFGVERRMNTLRTEMGVIDVVPHEDLRRIEFNRLHVWSTRLEGTVFLCGFVLLFLEVREKEKLERRF